jgi:Ca2+-dependent lipid-binding protein
MDPYCVFTYQGKKQKSIVLDEAGKTPKWENQIFEFDIVDLSDQIDMAIMDEDVTIDDNVGETIMGVGDLIVKGGVNTWFEIYYKKKSAGSVHLATTWVPSLKKPVSILEESKEATKAGVR